MKQIYNKVSPLIESQIPAFYREEGPFFVAFVKEYYKWLEGTDNPLYYSRNLLSFRDVDSTLDEFLPHFQQKYLQDVSFVDVVSKRDLIKHALDIYRSKGTIHSLRLMFRLLFKEEIDVYYPGDDILRASDGVWIVPSFIELTVSPRNKTLVGKTVRGSVSGSYGFVESIVTKNNNGKVIDVAYLTNVYGDFITGELVNDDGVIQDSPKIVGSMSQLLIDAAGSGFEVGQVVDVISTRTGKGGKARVTAIGVRTGEVNYRLEDGGYGYTLNANIFGTSEKITVSANVLSLTSYTKTDPYSNGFSEETTITQPLVNVSFDSAEATIAANTIVYGSDSLGNTIVAGYILQSNQVANTGWLLISPRTISTLSLSALQNPNTTGSYILSEQVYQNDIQGETTVGIVLQANSTVVTLDRGPNTSPINETLSLIGRTSNCITNINVSENINLTTTPFDANVATLITTSGNSSFVTSSDLSAVATVVGANSEAVGIKPPSLNNFVNYNGNYVYNNDTLEYAYVTTISTGFPGGAKIGAVANTETIYLNTDLLSSNNTGNVPFLSVQLDSSNSNAATNTGFGFPAYPTANLSSVIGVALTQNAFTIGTIASLTERNPGANNTSRPFVLEKEQIIASYGKKEIKYLYTSGSTGLFSDGEIITQSVEDPAISANVSGVVGIFNTLQREPVMQVRSDGNTVYGEIYTASVVGGAGTLRIRVADTANTFNNSNVIVGVWSNAVSTPSSVSVNNITTAVQGSVVDSNTSVITIKKRSFYDFTVGDVFGSESGTTANITYIAEDASSNVIGNNAFIDAAAGISNGTISSVEVMDAGNFYEEGETVALYASNNQITASATVVLGKQGVSTGYWKDTRGFLSSDKYIQDNDYYQEYSYEIQTGIDSGKYEEVIKNTVHTAGTKMFSSFNKKTLVESLIIPADNTYNKLFELVVDTVSGFSVDDRVSQLSNTVSGIIAFVDAAINTISINGIEGAFTSNTVLVNNTTNATCNVISTNIQIS